MTGPLTGLRVVELASLAPGPFAAMMLSDLGAEVLRVDRVVAAEPVSALPAAGLPDDPLARGRRSVAIDLKHSDGAATFLHLAAVADVVLEGFRPGVCERLGIGPAACLARNDGLVYARVTGWGQDGPLAHTAGHDIDYLAVSGALDPIGPGDAPPVPPLNYVGDFAGGGMLAVIGILAALWERDRSGRGQVVDAAMVEGAALLSTHLHGLRAAGGWPAPRGGNLLDGGAPFYRTYACADGRFVAVGALEPRFYAELLKGLGLTDAGPDGDDLPDQYERGGWPVLHQRFAEVFATRTRDEWARQFADTDACVAPVLDQREAPEHPHLASRRTFVEVGALLQPGPAPKLSRTPGAVQGPAPHPGEHTREALRDWGFTDADVTALLHSGAVATSP
ncbi:CaiB/BaiF CoA-transferase family protein [Actinopolymorpha sp. B11F2]|uniref:CaiB/BaiF CoA transferase family protein n=1 Tax=Actinopolymorpha sp. B11F2 TaxID=3160862 RepID=UPI0032E5122F